MVPNPKGDDSQLEEITLKNMSAQPVSLVGWHVRDLAGQTWTLDSLGTLQSNQEKTIRRNGQPMALNNNGDTIDLLNGIGQIVQTVTYGHVDEDEAVIPNP
jgi:hypothetical protein